MKISHLPFFFWRYDGRLFYLYQIKVYQKKAKACLVEQIIADIIEETLRCVPNDLKRCDIIRILNR